MLLTCCSCKALLSLSHPPCASSAPFPPPRRRSGGGTGLAPCGACATSAIQQWEETGNRATGGCKLTVVTPKRLAERGGGEAERLRLRLRRRLQQRGRWRRSALPPYPPTSTLPASFLQCFGQLDSPSPSPRPRASLPDMPMQSEE